MTVKKGDVFGEETDEISMMVVTEIGGEGFRLAERFYNDAHKSDSSCAAHQKSEISEDGVVDWTHYWCPPHEFDERQTNKVASNHEAMLEAALDCVESQDIQKTEEIHGLR